MPLWYVLRGDELWAWTFAKSQKVRNLERDPRATLQVEAGAEYHELRGVMLKTDVTIHRDTDRVTDLGLELFRRYAGGELDDETARWCSPRRPSASHCSSRALSRHVGSPQARRARTAR